MTDLHDSPTSAPPVAGGSFTARYSSTESQKRGDPNWVKLKTLAATLGLTPTQVASAGAVSRPYISRLLNPLDPLRGSPEFWRRLESRLGWLVEHRTSQVFAVAVTPVDGDLGG